MSKSTKNFDQPPKIDNIQNVVENAQKLVENIGKQRSVSKDINRQRPEYDFRGTYARSGYSNNKMDNTTIE